jgi:hypothetical protein
LAAGESDSLQLPSFLAEVAPGTRVKLVAVTKPIASILVGNMNSDPSKGILAHEFTTTFDCLVGIGNGVGGLWGR